MQRVVDRLLGLPPATLFLALALVGVPLLPSILAYGLWVDHWPVARSGHPAFDDLSNLWLGARATLSGNYASLFNRDLHEINVAREFGARLTNQVWSYPPTIMLVLMPLGILPSYAWFAAVWLVAGLSLITAALVHRTAGEAVPNFATTAFVWCAMLLAPGAMMCINFGQTGLLTGGVLFFGLLLAVNRPARAGAILAILVAKPHLGLALPVVLLALGAYRAFLWTGVCAATYVLATLAVLGTEPWHLFLTVTLPEHVTYVETVAAGPEEGLKMTVFMLLRTLGLSKTAAMSLHVASALAVLGGLVLTLRSEDNRNIRFLSVALATLLVSPYLLGYELVLVSLAVGRVVLDPVSLSHLGRDRVLGLCAMTTLGHTIALFGISQQGVNPTALLVLMAYAWLAWPHVQKVWRMQFGTARVKANSS